MKLFNSKLRPLNLLLRRRHAVHTVSTQIRARYIEATYRRHPCCGCDSLGSKLHSVCTRFAQDLRKICTRFAQDLHKICTTFAQDLHKHEIRNRMNADRSSCVGTDPVNRFFFAQQSLEIKQASRKCVQNSREDHVLDPLPVPVFSIEDRDDT